MRLNGWAPATMATYLGVTRFTVHRLETYRRRPGPETLERIAALPNFPMTIEQLRADFDAHYTREPLRRSA